jgi:SEC-C motif
LPGGVLNAAQLQRIENVHAGFLYQHLFAVSVLLSWVELRWQSVSVERDEDLEITIPDRRIYVQIKKRAGNLTYSDIGDTLARCAEIRAEHRAGRRQSAADFWVVCNSEPGPELLRRIQADSWPDDVFIRTPNICTGNPSALPQVFPTIEDASLFCAELAARVPHSTLRPETLVWKLAALVQLASTGAKGRDHSFTVEVLDPLLEQLLVQLQRLPEAPEDYRPQDDEPPYESDHRVRLLTGFSGAGKTSWAAEMGSHSPGRLIYFDIADLPSAAVASSLAREIAAQLLPSEGPERKAILLPGVSGLQSLRLIDRFIGENFSGVTVILDNSHRIESESLIDVVRSIVSVHWIVLAQNWPGAEYFLTSVGATAEPLSGWSRESIAQEARANNCFTSIETCENLHNLTGGLPLFVRDACRLCRENYQGNLAAFVQDLADQTNVHTSSQQIIVSRVFDRLASDSQAIASLLSFCTLPFSRDDVLEVTSKALRLTKQEAATHLRTLNSWGIVRFSASGNASLHDSFYLLATERLSQIARAVVASAKEALFQIVWRNREGGGPNQFRLLCRLLLDTRRIEQLIDAVTSVAELVVEYDLTAEITALVVRAAEDPELSDENRFWAEDTLTFWAMERKSREDAERHLQRMRDRFERFEPSRRARVALIIKELLFAGLEGDERMMHTAFTRALAAAPDDLCGRIVRYNYACGLLKCGQPKKAAEIATELVSEYYGVLGITPNDVFLKKLYETAARIRDIPDKGDEIKRLADSLDLQGSALHKTGISQPFAKLHAHKFYLLSSCFTSAVRVGQDFVDECLSDRADADAACDFIENFLLPVVREQKMIGALVPVSCQYAVVLAYCGRIREARHTLDEMRPYIVPGTLQAEEYDTQSNLVELIGKGLKTLRRSPGVPLFRPEAPVPQRSSKKVGRNDPCPCGSQLKFKKCHGR